MKKSNGQPPVDFLKRLVKKGRQRFKGSMLAMALLATPISIQPKKIFSLNSLIQKDAANEENDFSDVLLVESYLTMQNSTKGAVNIELSETAENLEYKKVPETVNISKVSKATKTSMDSEVVKTSNVSEAEKTLMNSQVEKATKKANIVEASKTVKNSKVLEQKDTINKERIENEEETFEKYVNTPYVIECTAYCPTGNMCYDETWPVEGETVAGMKTWIGLSCNLYYVNQDGSIGDKIGTYKFHDIGFGDDPDGDGIGSIETGERIDLFMENYTQAMEWGVKKVYIEFLDN